MRDASRQLPPLLAQLHQLPFDYADGQGIDFAPYPEFLAFDDTTRWIKAWTGNPTLTGAEYRVFGQDGSGGYAAIWLARAEAPLLGQPVVFFGSEGALGVIATNLADYHWLLAAGVGPLEAVEYAGEGRTPVAHFAKFAEAHAAGARRNVRELLAAGAAEFPTFVESVLSLCR